MGNKTRKAPRDWRAKVGAAGVGLLPWSKEEALLETFEKRALAGEWITAKQMLPEICRVTGKEISLAYVYRLSQRHQWRKLGPRPRHVKADPQAQEEFKKNSRSSSRRR